jgi:predicted Zn-dependent protease with MMP-like domain
MTDDERRRFDEVLETVLEALPPGLQALLAEAPVIVEDRPSAQLLRELDLCPEDLLCGLHTGTPLTERSVEHSPELPETIHLFREGILELAGDWVLLQREIRITLLHEIGHHFGLNENDLAELGYE